MNSKNILIFFVLFALSSCLLLPKQSYSFSKSSFSSFSYSSNGGKPEKHIKSDYIEEYKENKGKMPEIRKYQESIMIDNDEPAQIKKKADTNVEDEKMLLKDNNTEQLKLNKEQLKKYLNQKKKQNLSSYKHGVYDKFLKTRAMKQLYN